LPPGNHFHILSRVIKQIVHLTSLQLPDIGRILKFTFRHCFQTALPILFCVFCLSPPLAAQDTNTDLRKEFMRAWQAAARGDRSIYKQNRSALEDYLLYPYLQYEDLRHRRVRVDEVEMADFLESHADWAFAAGLKTVWLRTLGEKGKWDSLIRQAPGSKDTKVQCHLAHARIQRGQTDGLLPVAQALWTVGESQPDACDPVFVWLKKQDGISSGLAWERIRLAMEARQPRLTLYLARFLDADERVWVDRWQQQERTGYHRLDRASKWQDSDKSRDITSYGLRRLSRSDPDQAWKNFQVLDTHYAWPADTRGGILREIALWSAVEGAAETPQRMIAVPETYRDGKLLEWWVRFDLSRAAWEDALKTIAAMPPDLKDDTRWRYWQARALLETGDTAGAQERFSSLALEANYYGFLAADLEGLPYTICPQEPTIVPAEVEELRRQAGFERALELR
jgi:soluble lytic murein transglycosylase